MYAEYESMNYGAHTIIDDTAYIIISGKRVSVKSAGKERECTGCTKLLVIKNGHVEEIVTINEQFMHISSVCVVNDTEYVGMDKMVAAINLKSHDYKLFSAISTEDEQELLETKGDYLR